MTQLLPIVLAPVLVSAPPADLLSYGTGYPRTEAGSPRAGARLPSIH